MRSSGVLILGIAFVVSFAFHFTLFRLVRFEKESDVDIALMYSAPLETGQLIRLSGDISTVFGRTVDLLDLHRAGPIVSMEVLRTGKPVIINDPLAFENFRMYTPVEYYDFKFSRLPAETALKAWVSS